MELGLHLPVFTYADGPPALGRDLSRIAAAAEDAGYTKLSVMDHVFQIQVMGPPELDMLEAYTTLGYLAARTTRIRLLAWVTAVVYREPGLLAKCVSTLDVLSEGRAWLGIGAAWNEEEAVGLGLPFPPTAERFERLEEALQIFLQMCSDDDGPYDGKHYHLAETINLFASAELERKLDVLREHCADVGRDYDEIQKTVMMPLDVGPNGEHADALVDRLHRLAELGIQHVHGGLRDVGTIKPIEIMGERVIPAVAGF